MNEGLEFCKKRYHHLLDLMHANEIDLILLSQTGQTLKRIADTTSGTALIIPVDGDARLFCYSVDINSTREESWFPVKEITRRSDAEKIIVDHCNQLLKEKSRIGIELSRLSHNFYSFIKENMKGEMVDVGSTLLPEVFFGLYPDEVHFQRKVSELADLACTAVYQAMRPGITEYELAAEAEYTMRRKGAQSTAFNTIVSTGPRSAYSHGWPTNRKLCDGEFLLVDLGPQIDGYASDETRTYLLGSDPKKEKMIHALDKAVQVVLDNIKPGVNGKELDKISRKALADQGFPSYPHSLGHPLSGFVTPNLSESSAETLKEGMLFTVEPGIYIPGFGGVRMEENVVVTSDGYEQLTKSPRIL